VTGGAGFIGANFVLDWFEQSTESIVNLDKLTYAGDLGASLRSRETSQARVRPRIYRRSSMRRCAARRASTARIVNFAAESPRRPSRSTDRPRSSRRTSSERSLCSKAARTHWSALPAAERSAFRFLHVSTDEVFGSLAPDDSPSSRRRPMRRTALIRRRKPPPIILVRAYHPTYGTPGADHELLEQLRAAAIPRKA
jgi:dTDP-glucose 4,6-dehydratase